MKITTVHSTGRTEAAEVALDGSYEAGARDALQAVAKALRADRGPEVLGLTRLLDYSPERVNEVLVKLDRLGSVGAAIIDQGGESSCGS